MIALEHDTPSDVLAANADWAVLPDGLEHRANGYFIARETLAARRGALWEWPLHMAEKSWCRPRLLREAFTLALAHYGIAPDAGLARSFALGFGIRADARDAAPADAFVRLGEVVQARQIKPDHQAPRAAPRPRRAAA